MWGGGCSRLYLSSSSVPVRKWWEDVVLVCLCYSLSKSTLIGNKLIFSRTYLLVMVIVKCSPCPYVDSWIFSSFHLSILLGRRKEREQLDGCLTNSQDQSTIEVNIIEWMKSFALICQASGLETTNFLGDHGELILQNCYILFIYCFFKRVKQPSDICTLKSVVGCLPWLYSWNSVLETSQCIGKLLFHNYLLVSPLW